MNELKELLHNPYFMVAAGIVVNAMIDNLPAPDATSGKLYRFFYGTVHSVVGRIKTARNGGNGNGNIASGVGQMSQAAKDYADLGK